MGARVREGPREVGCKSEGEGKGGGVRGRRSRSVGKEKCGHEPLR